MTMLKPQVFTVPFASGGTYSQLPLNSSTSVANQVLGYPPVFATPYSAGGLPVDISQTNGIYYSYSTQSVWLQGGGTFTYETTWVSANGGYDSGVVLWYAAAKRYVVSLINNNNNNFLITPSLIDGTHWQYLDIYSAAALFPDITDNTSTHTVSIIGSGGLSVTNALNVSGGIITNTLNTSANITMSGGGIVNSQATNTGTAPIDIKNTTTSSEIQIWNYDGFDSTSTSPGVPMIRGASGVTTGRELSFSNPVTDSTGSGRIFYAGYSGLGNSEIATIADVSVHTITSLLQAITAVSYARIPSTAGNFLIQWGQSNNITSLSSLTVSLSQSYTSGSTYSVLTNCIDNSGAGTGAIVSQATGSFVIKNYSGTSNKFNWISIGY